MEKILLFSLICYGASNIVVYSTLFEPMRNLFKNINEDYLGKLVSCMMCFPTWFGFLLSTTLWYCGLHFLSPSVSWGITIPWLAIFLDGILSSATTWLIHTLQEYFQYNTPPTED